MDIKPVMRVLVVSQHYFSFGNFIMTVEPLTQCMKYYNKRTPVQASPSTGSEAELQELHIQQELQEQVKLSRKCVSVLSMVM